MHLLDVFFELLIEDGIIDNVWSDSWNEIDNVNFLDRGINRCNEYPNGKTISPSYGHLPNLAGDAEQYFSRWADFIARNNSIPDQISLHFLYGNRDLNTSISSSKQYLEAGGIDYQGV
ncbi:unnamed protein product [Clonostachys rhizophaga]|uniref:Uncharacterized protein n=1 Tax=Clonostachys rhizophaga TaxID=160324 RepID=A0A9N9VN93_9HYPO|nr:unnamed protein product [Clonostachys rhizophaga]